MPKLKSIRPLRRVTRPVEYPSGVVVDDGLMWYYIVGEYKRPVLTERVRHSWHFEPLAGTGESLSLFKEGKPLGYRSGSLIQNFSDGKYYYIQDSKKRHITSPDVFDKYGFEKSRVYVASDEETNLHEDGEDLT